MYRSDECVCSIWDIGYNIAVITANRQDWYRHRMSAFTDLETFLHIMMTDESVPFEMVNTSGRCAPLQRNPWHCIPSNLKSVV